MKFLLVFITLATTLAQYGETSPDFAVPSRMVGVGSGNLGGNGNVVQNTNRVLNILAQFQSITEWLYDLQTPELYRLATGYRSVMDSLVQSGSPIFQALSNAARLSSGNISTIFTAIQRSINTTIFLDDLHQSAINRTELFLGSGTVQNFSSVLDQLVRKVANLSTVLDEIEPVVEDIQRLIRPSQAQVDALYPRTGVRKLNEILQDYVNIGTATIPQINAVVNRVRLMDGFIARLSSVTNALWSNLNSSMNAVNASVYTGVQTRLQSTMRAIRTSFNTSVNVATKRLKLFFLDDVDAVRQAAQNSSALLGARLANVTETLQKLEERTNVTLIEHGSSNWVMNHTIRSVMDLAWGLAFAVTSSTPQAETCFRRYNYEFDKIPRLIYSWLAICGQEEARTLQDVAAALAGFLGVTRAQLDAEAKRYNQCLDGLTPSSTNELKLQRRVCLQGADRISDVFGYHVVNKQLDAFEGLLRDEVAYSGVRYYTCTITTRNLMLAEVETLRNSIVNCLK